MNLGWRSNKFQVNKLQLAQQQMSSEVVLPNPDFQPYVDETDYDAEFMKILNNDEDLKTIVESSEENQYCIVWRWRNTPDALRNVFTQYGDEEYLVLIPDSCGSMEFTQYNFCNRLRTYEIDTDLFRGSVRVGTH